MRRLRSFLLSWWHIPVGIAAALLAFFTAPALFRLVDPTAAPFDAGILHVINLVNVELLIYSALSFIGIIVTFRPLARWFKHDFKNDFTQLKPAQKCALFFSLYSLFLLSFVLLSLAL